MFFVKKNYDSTRARTWVWLLAPSNAEIKKERLCISTLICAFLPCKGTTLLLAYTNDIIIIIIIIIIILLF